MANIYQLSFWENKRLGFMVAKDLKDPSNYTSEEFILVAEKALIKHPNEWVIYFSLGDKYQDVGRYADSVRVGKRCVELKPNEIKSTYALATAFHILTWAAWSKEEADIANRRMMGFSGTFKMDPERSQAELDKLNITVETAAAQAIKWFNRSLELNPDPPSIQNIMPTLQALYKRFPGSY